MLAPICLFTYNRLKETKQTISALQQNYLAKESELFIFSDGGKNSVAKEKVLEVRHYLKTIEGFKKIEIIESPINKGLANSIISGVTKIINQYGKAIVLEDDLSTTPNFLDYLNQALDVYKEDSKVISICGYGLKIKKPKKYTSEFYLYGRSSSWGWAIWKEEWNSIDWEVKDWSKFKTDKKAIRGFNYNGSDMFKMLKSTIEGSGNSWAIRFSYAQFKQKKYSIMPFESFVDNNGFSSAGTNTKFKFSRFKTIRNKGINRTFNFNIPMEVNKKIEKECYKYHSILIRIYSRLRYTLGI